jgi:hypothetical protein
MEKIASEGSLFFTRLVKETGLDAKRLLQMQPTLATLNDMGVGFNSLAGLIETGFWR